MYDPLLPAFKFEEVVHIGKDDPVVLKCSFCTCEYYTIWLSFFFLLELLTVVILAFMNCRVR